MFPDQFTCARRFLLLLGALLATRPDAHAFQDERLTAWQEDVEAYAETLEARHIDLFHTLPRDRFYSQIDALTASLPTLSDAEIVASLMRITHAIGDGHTAMPLWGSGYHRYPIKVRWIGSEALIVATSRDNIGLLGARITHWNGQEIDAALEQLAPYVPFVENPQSAAVRVGMYLTIAELGHAIGLSPSASTTRITIENHGSRQTLSLDAMTARAFRERVDQQISYRRQLGSGPDVIEAPGIRFAALDDNNLGYIQFDSYPSGEEMDAFAQSLTEMIAARDIRNIAIDFRENFGGNFYVGLLLAEYLNLIDTLDWQNGIYVLTSGITFSAAMSNSAQYTGLLNARRIGEPTGATPCGYQDMGQFNLPHSGFLITYSKRRFCFADPVEDALDPDVGITTTADDYRMSRDPVLEWVLNDITTRSE